MNDVMREFLDYYRIKEVRPVDHRDNYRSAQYSFGRNASYYSDSEQMIAIEMGRRSFDELVHNDKEYERLRQNHRQEAYIRSQYPAIAEAYSKYIMLLELYK